MGRFYRTTSDTPIDYMYRSNTPLMERVLMANDRGITNTLDNNAQARALANFNYLPQDQDEATKLQKSIDEQADTITRNIQGDYANYKKQLPALRNFRQSLMDNYTNGPISKYQSNYNARKAAFDAIDKQTSIYDKSGGTKGVSQIRALMAKQYADTQFSGGTGYNASTKAYNTYKGISLMDDIDVPKRLSEGLEKMKADGELIVSDDLTKGGQYFNKKTGKTEAVTPERILSIVSDRLQSDTGLMDYLRQDTQIGHTKGVFDSEGRFISPYSYTPVNITPEQSKQISLYKDKIAKLPNNDKKKEIQLQLDNYTQSLSNKKQLHWNENSSLAPAIQGIIRQFSYSKNENKNEFRNNSLYNTQYSAGQSYLRQTRQLRQADEHFNETQKNIGDRFKEKMDWDKYKFENPQAKVGTTKAGTTAPVETTTSKLGANSFESMLVPDGNNPNKEVPYFSNAGLSSQIDALRKQKGDVDSQLKDINSRLGDKNIPFEEFNELNLKKENLQRQSTQLKASQDETTEYYQMSTEAVLQKSKNAGTPLADGDIKIYKEYSNDRDASKHKTYIDKLRKIHPDVLDKPGNEALGFRATTKPAPEVQRELDKLDQYISAKKRVDKGRDEFLSNIRKTYLSTDAIVPNEKEGQEVSNMILNNPQGLQIFNDDATKAGGTLDGKGLAWGFPGSDNYNIKFGGSNDLAHYIEKNNVKMNIKQIGGTIDLGNGNAVVKVTFDDKNGQIPKDKPFYISLSHDLQRDIAGKFNKHKNPEVAKIATSLGDDEANNLRNQMATPDRDKTIFITTPMGTQVPIRITKLDGDHIHVGYEDKNGNPQPFLRVGEKVGTGIFNGPEDWIEQYKGHKKVAQLAAQPK